MAKFNRYEVHISFKWYEQTFHNTVYLSYEGSAKGLAEKLRDKVIQRYKDYGWCCPEKRQANGLPALPQGYPNFDGSKADFKGDGWTINWGTQEHCAAFHKSFTVLPYRAPAFPVYTDETYITVA